MEKQEAQEFVNECLSMGYEKRDIAEELSLRLGAPPDVVMRFVEKVSASHLQMTRYTDSPSLRIDQEDNKSEEPAWKDEGSELTDIYDISSIDETDDFSASRFIEEKEPLPDQEESQWEYSDQNNIYQDQVNTEELEQLILRGLKKHRRHSDIVQSICEKTGWNWNQAQRFVARTQTSNHPELTRSNRLFMIPFSSLFIIGGVLLLIWAGLTLYDYYNGWTDQGTSTLPMDFILLIIAAFFTSFGIIAGGIFSLYRTLSKQ